MGNNISQEEIQNTIQHQSDFEHWKMLANEMAVDAMTNSDKLAWRDMELKLVKANSFYDKTLGFKFIYDP